MLALEIYTGESHPKKRAPTAARVQPESSIDVSDDSSDSDCGDDDAPYCVLRRRETPASDTSSSSGSESETASESDWTATEPEEGEPQFRRVEATKTNNSAQNSSKLIKFTKKKNWKRAKEIFEGMDAEQKKTALKAKDGEGRSVLHHAANHDLADWVRILLQNGADVNQIGAMGWRPLHYAVITHAVKGKASADNKGVIELLLDKGADPNEKDESKQTPVMLAVSSKDAKGLPGFKKLVAHERTNVDVEIQVGHSHITPLLMACQQRRFDKALVLIKETAKPMAEGADKNTPLIAALHHIKKNPSREGLDFAHEFIKICQEKHHDVKKILTVKNKSGQSALSEAAKVGDLALFQHCYRIVFPTDQTDGDDDDEDVENEAAVKELTAAYGRNMMHEACKYGRVEVVRFLYEKCPGLAKARDEMKLTPLHLACKMNRVDTIREMCKIMSPVISVEDDHVTETPSLLKYASKRGSIEALLALLESKESTDAAHITETLRNLLKWLVIKGLSDIVKVLLDSPDRLLDSVPEKDLQDLALLSAKTGQERCMAVLQAWKTSLFRNGKDNDGNNALHIAASKDYFDCVRTLLKSETELNTHDKSNTKQQTPLHIAVESDHYRSCQLLIQHANKTMLNAQDMNGRTALHLASRNGNMSIMKLLLDRKDDLDKTLKDKFNYNCLDHAIKSGQEMTAIKLLGLEEWKLLMKNSTQEHGDQSKFRTTPMRKLIRHMPVAAKFVLDKCIRLKNPETQSQRQGIDGPDNGGTRNGTDTQGPPSGVCTHHVELMYEFLDDWFSDWMEEPSEPVRSDGSRGTRNGYDYLPEQNRGQPASDSNGNVTDDHGKNWNENGTLIDDANAYVTDTRILTTNHPLNIMIKSDNKDLLSHPVVEGLCQYKWKRLGRTTFWTTLFIYLAFLISLTGHVMVIPPTFYILLNEESPNGYIWLADGRSRWVDRASPCALFFFGQIGRWIVLVLALVNFTFTCIRIAVQRTFLLNTSELFNLVLDITPQVLAILIILPVGCVHYMNGVYFKPDWQWECGALAVFLVWMNFIMFLKRIPFIGIYVLMFTYVFRSFLNFIIVFGLFIFSFAVVFHILLLNQSPFNTLGVALAKTLAMTSGEVDFGATVQPFDYLHEVDVQTDFLSIVFYPIGTNILMAVFIIIMPILVSNLLTGLAVDDVGEIQRKAKIYRKTLQINAMLAVERRLPYYFWRRSVIRMHSFTLETRPSSFKKFLYRLTGFKDSYDYLKYKLKDYKDNEGPAETDKTVDMRFDDLSERVMVIDTKLSMITPAYSMPTKGTMSTDDLNQQIAKKLDKVLAGMRKKDKRDKFRDKVKATKK